MLIYDGCCRFWGLPHPDIPGYSCDKRELAGLQWLSAANLWDLQINNDRTLVKGGRGLRPPSYLKGGTGGYIIMSTKYNLVLLKQSIITQ